MVPNNVEQISSRHLDYAVVQELAAKGGLRLRQCALQETDIPNACHSAIACDLICVDFQNLVLARK